MTAAEEIVNYIERLVAEGRVDEIPRECKRLRGVLHDIEEDADHDHHDHEEEKP